jgi:peptidoglycan/LPS O-acetylase OafA/YrhL
MRHIHDSAFERRSSTMSALKNPRITLLPETNLDERFFHSILISLFRGLAALIVVAAHVRAQTLPGLRSLPDPTLWYQAIAFFTGFAHQAVVVFFLVSGWLVGGSLLNKLNQANAIFIYCIDRITRLWMVLIPSFLVTLLFGALSGSVDLTKFDHAIGNEYSTRTFVGNLFGLQDLQVPRFGGNFALWSLAFEMWYYVLFPLVLMAFLAPRKTTRVISAIGALILASQLSMLIWLYFSVWTLGVLFSRIRIELDNFSLFLLLAIFATVAVYFRLTGEVDMFKNASFLQDLLYSFLFLVLLSSQQRKVNTNSPGVRLLKTVGEFWAKFSFTLYVIHVPLLMQIKYWMRNFFAIHSLSPEKPSHLAIYFAIVSVIVLFSYVFYLLFEAHTPKVRRFLKVALLPWNERRSRGSQAQRDDGAQTVHRGPRRDLEPGGRERRQARKHAV